MQGVELFLGEEFLGRFLGLPVNPDIGHHVQPIARRRIDGLKIRQWQAVEKVLLYITHAIFHASFFLGLGWATGPDFKAMMVGKIQVTRVERDQAGCPAQDSDLTVIDPYLPHHTAEVFQGVLVA